MLPLPMEVVEAPEGGRPFFGFALPAVVAGIQRRLAAFGVHYIEGGFAGSNPKDAEFFARAQSELSQEAKQKLVAFGSTRSKRSATADQDPQLRALVESGAPTACIVCKASSWQTTDILGASREDNLDMISSSVAFLRKEGLKVHVDLEHFYDGFLGGRAAEGDSEYSLECACVAVAAGAERPVERLGHGEVRLAVRPRPEASYGPRPHS